MSATAADTAGPRLESVVALFARSSRAQDAKAEIEEEGARGRAYVSSSPPNESRLSGRRPPGQAHNTRNT